MITRDNHIINGLWIGENFSNIELLTILSYLKCGHTFQLWCYTKNSSPFPPGVIIRDAGEIIPSEKIFTYKNKNQFGHGKGSYGGFSDIFRYKLLYEHGGWWTDMDVVCLKPLDFEDPYVFRTHQILKVVGNIMKCPPKSELMKICYEKAVLEVNENNTDWHKPIQILNDTILKLGLEKFIREFSNPDSWKLIRKLLVNDFTVPENWHVVHWVNEEWKRNRLDKNYFTDLSFLGILMKKYGLKSSDKNSLERISERIKLTYACAALRQLPSFIARILKFKSSGNHGT